MTNILKRYKKKIFLIVIASIAIYLGFTIAAYFTARAILTQTKVLHQMGEMTPPVRDQKILIFSPHQDDETIGTGGYIATAIDVGAKVEIVLVTDGNKRKLRTLRYREFESATHLLGVPKENLTYLKYPDSSLKNQDKEKLKTQFTEIIEQKKPDIVISPYSKDIHPDHATIGVIIEEIVKEKNIKTFEYLVHVRKFPANIGFSPNLYLLPPVSLASEPNYRQFVLPPNVERLKSKAISIYHTQMFSPSIQNLFKSMVRRNELFLEVK